MGFNSAFKGLILNDLHPRTEQLDMVAKPTNTNNCMKVCNKHVRDVLNLLSYTYDAFVGFECHALTFGTGVLHLNFSTPVCKM